MPEAGSGTQDAGSGTQEAGSGTQDAGGAHWGQPPNADSHSQRVSDSLQYGSCGWKEDFRWSKLNLLWPSPPTLLLSQEIKSCSLGKKAGNLLHFPE